MDNFLKTKFEIEAWLQKYNLKNYTLIKNEQYGWVVNIEYSVFLGRKNLNHIPVKFHMITGNFACNGNQLKDLSFAPIHVGGFFDCAENLLTNLHGSPQVIGSHYDCSQNQLVSLEGITQIIPGCLRFQQNKLKTLEGGPHTVQEQYYGYENPLESLEFCPEKIGGATYIETTSGRYDKIHDFQSLCQARQEELIQKEQAYLAALVNLDHTGVKSHSAKNNKI